MSINYLLFLLLPVYLLKISLTKNISINLLEIITILAIISNIYPLLKFQNLTSKKFYSSLKKIFNRKVFLPFFLIIIGFCSSYIYNTFILPQNNWSDGLGKLLDLIILPIIYAFSLVYYLQTSKQNQFKKIFSGYLLSVILVAILGVFFLTFHKTTFDNRLKIFFQSANQLAIFLAPAFLFLINFILEKTKKNYHNSLKKYWLIYLSCSLLGLNLFFSKSLGALLSITISIFLLFIIKNNSSKTINFIFKVTFWSIILFTLIIITTKNIFPKLHKQSTIPTSYESRLVVFQVSQKIISQHWIVGIGPGNFQNNYLSQQKNFPPYPQWAIPHAHNTLIQFWLEGGIFSLIGLLLIYNQILSFPKNITSKKYQKIKKTVNQQSIFVIISIYFLIHGLVDIPIWTQSSATLFWSIVILQYNNLYFPKKISENY